MKKLGLILLLVGAGAAVAGCDVGVRDTDEETPTPAAPEGTTPDAEDATSQPPAEDVTGDCPVGTWQLSGIDPTEGVDTGAGELSFTGGGSMILALAEDGTWTVTDDGSDPLDASLDAGGTVVPGTATIVGEAEGRYAGQGDSYLFETDSSSGTAELSAAGYTETLSMDDVLVAIVPTGQATVTCQGDTLTIDGGQARWEFTMA